MKPEFYLEVINPGAKKNEYLLALDIQEHRGRQDFFYTVFWPCDSLSKGKKESREWCKKENVEVLEIYEHRIEEIIHSNSKAIRNGKQ